MNIDEAHAFAREHTEKDTTYRHLVSVEGVMRRLGRHFGEDEHRWALTGLFHDLDQDQTADDMERHARLAADWLRQAGVEDDAVAWLLVAAALGRPDRSAGMKVSSVRKKLKERAFAPGVNRDEIALAETNLGLSL